MRGPWVRISVAAAFVLASVAAIVVAVVAWDSQQSQSVVPVASPAQTDPATRLFQGFAHGSDVWRRDPTNPYFSDHVSAQLGGPRESITHAEFVQFLAGANHRESRTVSPPDRGLKDNHLLSDHEPAAFVRGPVAHVQSIAERTFASLDRNGDGLLNTDEMSATLTTELGQWDANGDGLISREEYRAYFQARVARQQLITEGEALAGLANSLVSLAAQTPVAAQRFTPAGLPSWFGELDPRATGQISLFQWMSSGRSEAGFHQLDRNHDGLVTIEEVQIAVKRGFDPSIAMVVKQPDRPRGNGTSSLAANRPQTPSQIEHRAIAVAASPAAAPAATAAPAPAVHAAVSSAPSLASTPIALSGLQGFQAVREAQNEQAVAEGHANVLFLGDSITDLLQTGNGDPLWRQYYAPLGAVDFGVSGITTSQVLWQVDAGQVTAVSPNVVVLMIGTNNLAMGQDPADVANGIGDIVMGIQDQLPSARILLLSILPRGQSPADPLRAKIQDTNQRIAPLADGDQVRFLDLTGSFLMPDSSISPLVMSDYLHPTLFGYQIYTVAIWQPLMDALEGR